MAQLEVADIFLDLYKRQKSSFFVLVLGPEDSLRRHFKLLGRASSEAWPRSQKSSSSW